ncbi:hypothetical protein FN846DRAFT_372994 [Sphaerosporella brunnea]|uniref:Uncharacterized protein n=1 Tax=Sphaerosporella brunnea TaxID=1250544 RepID=A0A5J5EJJ0_9PEZI|nr:hypothetical protein FN846DRAFT_372994 [Sphaerosporella brunnea]
MICFVSCLLFVTYYLYLSIRSKTSPRIVQTAYQIPSSRTTNCKLASVPADNVIQLRASAFFLPRLSIDTAVAI